MVLVTIFSLWMIILDTHGFFRCYKSDVFSVITTFVPFAENLLFSKIKTIHSDSEGVFTSHHNLQNFFASHGILHKKS